MKAGPAQEGVRLSAERRPAEPDTADDVRKIVEKTLKELAEQPQPHRRGLLLPPENHNRTGCTHDWQPHVLDVSTFTGSVSDSSGRVYTDNGHIVRVKKCSKCHVLGDPP